VQRAARKVPQDELVVFPDAAEAVRPAVAAEVVEGDGGDEGRVTLAASDDALLPGREYR
jgi:hypothetical protein